jgi:HD superfamily phosphohydrolase
VFHNTLYENVCFIIYLVAHGSYSHIWDHTVYKHIYPGVAKGHDEHRKTFVRGCLSKLILNCGVDPEDIISVWDGKNPVLKAIVNGPVGKIS